METIPSFATLAARLTVLADEIRPADGARDDWAKVMALVVRAVLLMLACLCEALDARVAADAPPVVASASRDTKASAVPAPRSGMPSTPGRGACAPAGSSARGPRHGPEAGRCLRNPLIFDSMVCDEHFKQTILTYRCRSA